MKIIYLPDIHAKSNKYHLKGLTDFLQNEFLPLIAKYQETDEVMIIQGGDEFDTSSPHWDVWLTIARHMKLWPKSYVLSGNHTFSMKKGNATESLSILDNLQVILQPTHIVVDGKDLVLLPYPQTNEIKESYDLFCSQFSEPVTVVTHFASKENQFGDEGVLLNLPQGSVIVENHTHAPAEYFDENGIKHITVGVVLPTRRGEEDWEHRLIIQNTETNSFESIRIDASKYFTYETLKYPDKNKYENSLLTITDIPMEDKKLWRDNYQGLNERIISHRFKESDHEVFSTEENQEFVSISLESDLTKYGEKQKSPKVIVERCIEVIGEIRNAG